MKNKFLSLLYILYFGFFMLQAHPHVWNIANPSFVFDKNGLQEIKIELIWDIMFSEQLILDTDKNKDNKLSEKEKKWLKTNYFDNLQPYNYLATIKINGKEYKYEKDFIANDFDVYIDKHNQLIYDFSLPITAKKGQTVFFSFVDPTNYIAYETNKDNIALEGNKTILKKVSIDRDYCQFTFTIVDIEENS